LAQRRARKTSPPIELIENRHLPHAVAEEKRAMAHLTPGMEVWAHTGTEASFERGKVERVGQAGGKQKSLPFTR
jgi:hypothetical protein